MRIAFDAKRIFHNNRGLGNYGRDIVRLLQTYASENDYWLFNPKEKGSRKIDIAPHTHIVYPKHIIDKCLPSYWRSHSCLSQISENKIDIYHGLSQELPFGIHNTAVKTVVTMHDAIFMRNPELYSSTYRHIFVQKNKYACKVADSIIAISECTKRDIVNYFGADESKITVVYQGCNNIFRQPVTEAVKEQVRKKYNLPSQYVLTVGAIEKRKNMALLVRALRVGKIDVPLVIVGAASAYLAELQAVVRECGMNNRVVFLHNVPTADLPAVYALSDLFLFPSIYEGFGIPILEAMCLQVPVIASSGTCFEEVGGKAAMYASPYSEEQWADGICKVLSDNSLRNDMRAQGNIASKKFEDTNIIADLMDVYKKIY